MPAAIQTPRRSRQVSILCIADYELTQPTKAGARESTRADLIEERSQFPQRPTDVATGAPRSGHQAKAESVRFGGLSGLMLSCTEASRCPKAEPTHGKGGSDHARERSTVEEET